MAAALPSSFRSAASATKTGAAAARDKRSGLHMRQVSLLLNSSSSSSWPCLRRFVLLGLLPNEQQHRQTQQRHQHQQRQLHAKEHRPQHLRPPQGLQEQQHLQQKHQQQQRLPQEQQPQQEQQQRALHATWQHPQKDACFWCPSLYQRRQCDRHQQQRCLQGENASSTKSRNNLNSRARLCFSSHLYSSDSLAYASNSSSLVLRQHQPQHVTSAALRRPALLFPLHRSGSSRAISSNCRYSDGSGYSSGNSDGSTGGSSRKPSSSSCSKRRISSSSGGASDGGQEAEKEREGAEDEGEGQQNYRQQQRDSSSRSEELQQRSEVLLLHVLLKRGNRGHAKGMRKKTREEVLYEVQEAMGLARTANWRVIRGPSPPGTLRRWVQQQSCMEDSSGSENMGVVKEQGKGTKIAEDEDANEEEKEKKAEEEEEVVLLPTESVAQEAAAGHPLLPQQQQQPFEEQQETQFPAQQQQRHQVRPRQHLLQEQQYRQLRPRQHLLQKQKPDQREEQQKEQQQEQRQRGEEEQQLAREVFLAAGLSRPTERASPPGFSSFSAAAGAAPTPAAVSRAGSEELRAGGAASAGGAAAAASRAAAAPSRAAAAVSGATAASLAAAVAAGSAARASAWTEAGTTAPNVTAAAGAEEGGPGLTPATAEEGDEKEEGESIEEDLKLRKYTKIKREEGTAPGRKVLAILDVCSKGFAVDVFPRDPSKTCAKQRSSLFKEGAKLLSSPEKAHEDNSDKNTQFAATNVNTTPRQSQTAVRHLVDPSSYPASSPCFSSASTSSISSSDCFSSRLSNEDSPGGQHQQQPQQTQQLQQRQRLLQQQQPSGQPQQELQQLQHVGEKLMHQQQQQSKHQQAHLPRDKKEKERQQQQEQKCQQVQQQQHPLHAVERQQPQLLQEQPHRQQQQGPTQQLEMPAEQQQQQTWKVQGQQQASVQQGEMGRRRGEGREGAAAAARGGTAPAGAAAAKQQRKANFWSDDEEALAESCVVVVREEHPNFLFGKGKLQDIVAAFSLHPTAFVFISCSNGYTSAPLPHTLSSSSYQQQQQQRQPHHDHLSSFSFGNTSAAAAARGAAARGAGAPAPPGSAAADAAAAASGLAAAPHDAGGCCGAAGGVLHGDYGYYLRGSRSVVGRLMSSSSSNERNSCGLRPLQQQFLQQAFEAALVTAAAAAADRSNPHQQQRQPVLLHNPEQQQQHRAGDPLFHFNERQRETSEETEEAESYEEEEEKEGADWLDAADARLLKWVQEKKQVEVVDRQRVILEIFSQRAAHNKSAMLQVAVARVLYLRSRLLCGSDARRQQLLQLLHGSSGTSLPAAQKATWIGEVTQQYLASPAGSKADFERQQLSLLLKRLRQKVQQEALTRARQRGQSRSSSSSRLPRVAVVGYTNAGKTQLMNSLCRGNLVAADRLFCTLQIKRKILALPRGARCLLMDSVGFIQGLPLSLCGAFEATLEEVLHADILLHVIDVSHTMWQQQRRVVLQTLYRLACSSREAKERRAGLSEPQKQQQRRLLLRQQLLQMPVHVPQSIHHPAAQSASHPAVSSPPSPSSVAAPDPAAPAAGPAAAPATGRAAAPAAAPAAGPGAVPAADPAASSSSAGAVVFPAAASAATAGSLRLLEDAAAAADAEQAAEEVRLVEMMMGNGVQILEVWNKADLIQTDECMRAVSKRAPPNAVICSAKTSLGLDILIHMLEAAVETSSRQRRMYLAAVSFPVSAARTGFRYLHQQLHVEYDCSSSSNGEGADIPSAEVATTATGQAAAVPLAATEASAAGEPAPSPASEVAAATGVKRVFGRQQQQDTASFRPHHGLPAAAVARTALPSSPASCFSAATSPSCCLSPAPSSNSLVISSNASTPAESGPATEYSTHVYVRATLQQLQQLKKKFPTCRLEMAADPPALEKHARCNKTTS